MGLRGSRPVERSGLLNPGPRSVIRDITRRFVVVYHEWPVDSYDDEKTAIARMQEMKNNQLRSWREHWPMSGVDNAVLWSVQDMLKKSVPPGPI